MNILEIARQHGAPTMMAPPVAFKSLPSFGLGGFSLPVPFEVRGLLSASRLGLKVEFQVATRWVRWLKLPTRQVLIPWERLAGLHHERRWLRDRITLRARHWEALLALPFVSGDHWELVPLLRSSADHRALRRLLSESAYRLALVDAASHPLELATLKSAA
ncbi:MAG TPA: hypothetical protein P5016_04490 [Verrucomicrobiales bacterium]|nr:hypothetical protein [Verrucomicrobiales bacterium]